MDASVAASPTIAQARWRVIRRPRRFGKREGSITGWKDLPAARKADYGELVAPYLRTMDDRDPAGALQDAGG